MASSEVMQNDSGSFPSQDYSLLGEVEVPHINIPHINGDMNNSNYDFTNMQSALNTATSDSSIEVEAQLSELSEENSRLKEQLGKNSSMMEDLIKTIMSWRDHMIVSKNQLEDNLRAAKEKITSLEKEKLELFQKVDESLKEIDVQQKTKTCMQCAALESSFDNMLTLNSGEASDHVLRDWSLFRKNLHGNLRCVCQHLENVSATLASQEEKLMLDSYIRMLKFKIASLKGDVGELASLQSDEETDYEVVRLKTNENGSEQFCKVILELKQKLMEKDTENTCLTREKAELAEKLKECELKVMEWEMVHKSQFELLKNKLENESTLCVKYRERCDSLQQQIEEYEVKLEQSRNRISDDHVKELQEKLHNLEIILQMEQQNKQAEKEKYYAVMEKCEKLQVDYERVTKLLEIQSKDEKEKSEQLTLIESDSKKYMEEVDHLTAKLLEMQEQLSKSESEVKELQDQLAGIKDAENVETLKAQIEAYKADYYEEKVAKSAACDEIERLKHELLKLEKDSPGKSHSSRSSPKFRSRRRSHQRDEDEVVNIILCPICDKGFTDENAAQNHTNRCLEESQNDG